MKRNQKKYTKKNYKGGLVDKEIVTKSFTELNNRLDKIEQDLGILRTKIERKEVEVAKLLGPEINPMDKKSIDLPMRRNAFTDNPPSLGMNSLGASKSYEKKTPDNFRGENPLARQIVPVENNIPIEINRDQFYKISDAFNQLNKSKANKNQPSYNVQKSILHTFRPKLMDRSTYLKSKTKLNSEEEKELEDISYSLDLLNKAKASNYEGGRKSRRYIKSRRTRKHKK